MKIIQSFWPNNILDNKEKIDKLNTIYELSSFLLKDTLKNSNISIELVTNNIGKQLFKNIRHYDNVNLLLENDFFNNLDTDLWSAAKIVPMKFYNEDIIHVDGDFLLQDKKYFLNNINSYYDIIVQNKEFGQAYLNNYKIQMEIFESMFDFPKININYVYNCGIIGFKNKNAKNQYIAEFLYKISNCMAKMKIFKEEAKKFFKETNINCIFEQYTLAEVAFIKNYLVRELIPSEKILMEQMISGFSPENIFFHVAGPAKYLNEYVDIFKEILIKLYNNTDIKICDSLKSNDKLFVALRKYLYDSKIQTYNNFTRNIK